MTNITLSRPKMYWFEPKEDITAYELALALPAMVSCGDAGGYLERQPETVRRHFREQKWTYEQVLCALAQLYKSDPAAVAAVCDEALDKSGRLLGEVRNKARNA